MTGEVAVSEVAGEVVVGSGWFKPTHVEMKAGGAAASACNGVMCS